MKINWNVRRMAAPLLNAALWPLRTLLRLTRDGWLFALLAIACAIAASRSGEFANIPLLICLIMASMMLSGLVLSGLSLQHLKVARRCPTHTFAGEPVTVTLTVHNPTRLPSAGLLIVEGLRTTNRQTKEEPTQESQRFIQPLLDRRTTSDLRESETFATVVAGHDHERTQYPLLVRQRGLYRFRRMRLSTVFPFGFWRSEREQPAVGGLVVYPRIGEIDAALFKEVEEAMHRLRRFRSSREEHEFRGLREYRPGDNPKWIHWRYTARCGQWMVKEYETPQAKRVVVLLDTNLQRLGAQRLPDFERAISFAATVARELARRGCEVTTLTLPPGEPMQQMLVSRERRNLDVFLRLLAGLRPNNNRTLTDMRALVPRSLLHQAYVLVLGLGSVRMKADLSWLHSVENIVRVLDIRGEEFRRIFRRGPAGQAGIDDDLLPLVAADEQDEVLEEATA
jgi:uncharacterized protein (DUF58 family)